MESRKVNSISKENIDKFLDLFSEFKNKGESPKSLLEIYQSMQAKNKIDKYSFEESYNFISNLQTNKPKQSSTKLKVILSLLDENSVKKTDISQLVKNQDKLLEEIKTVQKQNDNLLEQISYLKNQNIVLKRMLSKNTTDKRIRSVAGSFLLLFSFSLLLYYTANFELIKIFWTKLGIFLSTGVYLIGFFIGKMIKKINVNDR